MDSTEFMNDAEVILNRLKTSAPRNTMSAIESALAGGEFSIAIKELVFGLSKARIEITAAEREVLLRIAVYLEERQLAEMISVLRIGLGEMR